MRPYHLFTCAVTYGELDEVVRCVFNNKRLIMTINRREALALGIATFLMTDARRVKAQDMAGQTVIVVGAGLAGLAAAQRLQAQGAIALLAPRLNLAPDGSMDQFRGTPQSVSPTRSAPKHS